MQATQLSFNEVLSVVKRVGHLRTVAVLGENGVGKTALFYAMKQDPQFADHIMVDPIDGTQLDTGSVWIPDVDRDLGISRELPNERFGVNRANQRGVNGSKPVVIFVDEFLKAPQFVKNMLAPVIYERRVGSYHLPEGSIVFIASNLSAEGLGDTLQAHLQSRIIPLHMRKPTAEEWVHNFAIPRGLHEAVIAYVLQHPHVMDSFLDYEPGGKYAGRDLARENGLIFNPRVSKGAFASPRTLHAASDVLRTCEGVVSDQALEAALDGTIGMAASRGLGAFVRFGRDLCAFERVLADPDNAPISDNPSAQLLQVVQFVTRVTDRAGAEATSQYVLRMRAEMQSVFINSITQSSKLALYVTVAAFTKMMAEHRIFSA